MTFYKYKEKIFFNIDDFSNFLSEMGIHHDDWPDYYNDYQLTLSEEIKIRIKRSKGQLNNEERSK